MLSMTIAGGTFGLREEIVLFLAFGRCPDLQELHQKNGAKVLRHVTRQTGRGTGGREGVQSVSSYTRLAWLA